jgi:ABC-type Na+ transport system ATPase subunit NatA
VTYSVRSATVRFGAAVALDDVTVEVPGGSVVAVVGGDGAGKSTLLRALAGEVSLDGGTVEAPPRQRLGYLPASSGSWAALTVAQNIDFVAGIYGLAGDQLAARRAELLDRAALTQAAGRLAAQLSGGMRRKLGFIMAIVHRPDLLILDEPSTGVDPVSRIDLWRLASEAAASGAAVLMSTTYLDEAERAASCSTAAGSSSRVPTIRSARISPAWSPSPTSPSGPNGPGAGAGRCTSTGPTRTLRIRRPGAPPSHPIWRTSLSRSRWPAATRFGHDGRSAAGRARDPPLRRVHGGGRRVDAGRSG